MTNRLRDGALAALVPVTACGLALAGLTARGGAGRAGSPARITVTGGKVLLPSAGVGETAASFQIVNQGGSADTLVRVTARAVRGEVTLSQHGVRQGNAAYRSPLDSVPVPAGDRFAMSPSGVDRTAPVPSGGGHPGELVTFSLEFRHTGRAEAQAVVVPPTSASLR
ncbi:copper chaperone PCu(A)C [Streptomyces antibioticus]|uniref:copper chaperone PCu(A)C n=1 Tax=Streptomyces antibioticus TaxID=1890 RepID=UPI0036B9B147